MKKNDLAGNDVLFHDANARFDAVLTQNRP